MSQGTIINATSGGGSSGGIGGVTGGVPEDFSVNTYADLPPAGDHTGEFYYVRTSTAGLSWPFLRNYGLYKSDGATWTKSGLTQADIQSAIVQAGLLDRDRTNHTGTQAISTVTGLQASLDSKASQLSQDAQDILIAANTAKLSATGNELEPGDIDTLAKLNAILAETLIDDTDPRLTDARAPLAHTHVKADITDFSDADYATAAQGALADTAVQPGDSTNLEDLDVNGRLNLGATRNSNVTNGPEFINGANIVEKYTDTNAIISGMSDAGYTEGDIFTYSNESDTAEITFLHDAASTGQPFDFVDNLPVTIYPGDTISFYYSNAKWRLKDLSRFRGPSLQSDIDTALAGKADIQPASFGTSSTINTDYVASRGFGIITNATGLLGNNYNFSVFTHEPTITPGLPGSFSFAGYYGGLRRSDELTAIDPNNVYKLGIMINQQPKAGFTGFTYGENHLQYVGISAFDIDGNEIVDRNHMAGLGSETTLAAPLTPGDTVITATDLSNWNDTNAATSRKGVVIREYKNSLGYKYPLYSRYYVNNAYELANINKVAGTITLTNPWPASLGNPDDVNGTWPVGSKIANQFGGGFKYSFVSAVRTPVAGNWYRFENWVGGIDTSGQNVQYNFSPGTAFIKVFVLPNFSNRVGGYTVYPDTGSDHKVYFAGWDMHPDENTKLVDDGNGGKNIYVLRMNESTGVADVILKPTPTPIQV